MKFYLHISKKEQLRRLLARIDDRKKQWKFAHGDVEERALWDAHAHAYEETIRNTATADAPWYVVPADHKWFTRLVVAAALVERLEALDLHFPKLSDEEVAGLQKARAVLTAPR
jgi:polyphosphate kinase 2 (PPK2 family)